MEERAVTFTRMPCPKARAVCRRCAGCGERPPRFRYGGVVKRDADHTLCFACHRALGNRMRERQRRMVLWLPHRRAHARGVTPDATIVAA